MPRSGTRAAGHAGRRARRSLGVALLLASGAIGCGRDADPAADASGAQLAARHCGACHLLPTPPLLDRETWRHYVLPRMARRLGLKDVGDTTGLEQVEGGIGGRLVREAGVYPDSARITRAEWERLAAYYLRGAPATLPRAATPAVAVGMPGFRVRVPDFHVASPMVTLVHVDAPHRRLYVADGTPGRSVLAVIDAQGHTVETKQLPSPVSHLRVHGDTLDVLFMGRLNPSDAPRGALARITAWPRNGAPTIAWEVDTLQRPVWASYADLSGDGVEDAVVSEFGNLTGRLAWYERRPDGTSRRHVLAAQPGAMNTVVRDVDGDGRPDVLALTAQGDEGIALFRGGADGAFTRESLLRFPPSYGSTSMALADVNGDGRPDLVYTNGDGGDYPGPPKPYHGVRVFVDDGRGRYVERFFFPMPGAFKAVARDFDGDGDVDLAAIAFYPDYAAGAPLSFVYLENVGGLRFTPHTIADADRGRWLTMDAGDVDGDGDDDLVLGSFAQLDAQGDRRELAARWRQADAPTVLVLENVGARRVTARPVAPRR